MKKLIIIVTLLLVTVSLFAQVPEAKGVDEKLKKNILRVHAETLFVFESDSNSNSWAAGSWDYALGGLGLSYSRLFNDYIGMTIGFGILAGGVEDPFSDDLNIDFFAGSYPFDIDRVGAFAKLGPYFRAGRFAITPSLEYIVVFSGDWKDEGTNHEMDQLIGLSCSFEYLISDSFLIFIEGAVFRGNRMNKSMWDIINSDDLEHESFFEEWYKNNNQDLLACSLTLGVGLAF